MTTHSMEQGELQKITRSLSDGGELHAFLRKSQRIGNSHDVTVSSTSRGKHDELGTTKRAELSSKLIPGNAARERSRVRTLRGAFQELQKALPSVPPDTKLSKLDVLVLATTYIAHLTNTLNEGRSPQESQADWTHTLNSHLGSWGGGTCRGYFHPVKKWPMRSRLYTGMAKPPHLQVVMETPPNITMPTIDTVKVEDTSLAPSGQSHDTRNASDLNRSRTVSPAISDMDKN